MIDYRMTKIGCFDYKVCNQCDAVNFSNFECPNCRRAMREDGAGEYIRTILDAVDERQGIDTTVSGCPNCESSEIEEGDIFCKICGFSFLKTS